MEHSCRNWGERERHKKLTSLITKCACDWYEVDRNRTNWQFSHLNLGMNSKYYELVRVMLLRHVQN